MERMVPTVTPKMAPAATFSMPSLPAAASSAAFPASWVFFRMYQARGRPTPSLHRASSTWETAVGPMFPWPWV